MIIKIMNVQADPVPDGFIIRLEAYFQNEDGTLPTDPFLTHGRRFPRGIAPRDAIAELRKDVISAARLEYRIGDRLDEFAEMLEGAEIDWTVP